MAEHSGSAPSPALAGKIDQLLREVRPPGEREYTYEEIAAALREAGGPTISGTYVWQLRKGIRDNPTKRHLEALARFFGVAPSYFFDEEGGAISAEELRVLSVMRDERLGSLAQRAAGLSSGSLHAILAVVENTRRLEGLPHVAVDSASTKAGRPSSRRRAEHRNLSDKV